MSVKIYTMIIMTDVTSNNSIFSPTSIKRQVSGGTCQFFSSLPVLATFALKRVKQCRQYH